MFFLYFALGVEKYIGVWNNLNISYSIQRDKATRQSHVLLIMDRNCTSLYLGWWTKGDGRTSVLNLEKYNFSAMYCNIARFQTSIHRLKYLSYPLNWRKMISSHDFSSTSLTLRYLLSLHSEIRIFFENNGIKKSWFKRGENFTWETVSGNRYCSSSCLLQFIVLNGSYLALIRLYNVICRLDQGRYKGLDEIYYWVSENAWYPLVMALVTQGIIWTTIGMLVVSPVIIAAKPGLFEAQTFVLTFYREPKIEILIIKSSARFRSRLDIVMASFDHRPHVWPPWRILDKRSRQNLNLY